MIDPERSKKAYAELFEITAEMTEIDPVTRILVDSDDTNNSAEWYRLRVSLITRIGFSNEEFSKLSLRVHEDVAYMREELEVITPQAFCNS